jgi:glycosyltransferase involved in cell wall biosynthesis
VKFSIVALVWNNLETMKYVIYSVLSQTYENIEYIILDSSINHGTRDSAKL